MAILNYGSLNIDRVYALEDFPRPGETITSQAYTLHPGGKGLNQSIACARAGAQVFHAGKVGADGAFLIETLEAAGVDCRHVVKDEAQASGHAVIYVNRESENCIVLHPGSNHALTEGEMRGALAGFGAGDTLLLQNEVNDLASLIELGVAQGLRIVLNPAPMGNRVRELPLERVDTLVVNETEAMELCERSSSDALVDVLEARYASVTVLLTLGREGSWLLQGGERLHTPACEVEAVDTTAAGDTFLGFYLGALESGKSQTEALQLASRAAAIAVSREGAAPSIPTLEEVLRG